ADVAAIDKVFDELAAPNTDPQLDWKVRHRENADRMTGGGLFGTVEVLRGLHALSRVRPLPSKERELYDNARHLLIGEIAAAMNIPLHVAEDNLDYALWPPPGMKRKGHVLPPATLGPPAPPAPAAAAPVAAAAADEEEETEEAPPPPPPKKPSPPPKHAPSKPAPAKHAPPPQKHPLPKKAAPAKKPAAKKKPAPAAKKKAKK